MGNGEDYQGPPKGGGGDDEKDNVQPIGWIKPIYGPWHTGESYQWEKDKPVFQLKEGAPIRIKESMRAKLKERGKDIPDAAYTVTKSGRRGMPLEDNFFYTIEAEGHGPFEVYDYEIELDPARMETSAEVVPILPTKE